MDDEHAIRLVRTLFGLARRRATGLLEVASDDRKARLSFSRGRLVFAEHKSLGSTLGAYLVSRGVLSRAQYQKVAEHVRHRTDRSPMLAFVEQAVVAGMLDVEQASTVVAGQVERNVVELFGWDTFDCRFTADEQSVEAGPRFPCELEPLVLQGLRARFDLAKARAHLASREDLYPRLEVPAGDLVRTYGLQPAELKAARMLTGERSVRQLFDPACGLDPTATAHLLLVLKLAQQIEWAESPGATGSSHDSSPAHAVPLAAIKLAKSAPSVRLTLPAPPSAVEIDAVSAFRRGVAAYKRGELEEARAQLARAVETHRHPEHALYAAWVEHEVAGRPRDGGAFATLADAARRALEHDATLAFAYFVVGHLHLMQNDALNAELAFRRAAKLDPTDTRAQHEAERLRAARHGRAQP
jgi:tetratricopeptide (TPR) repeat protein